MGRPCWVFYSWDGLWDSVQGNQHSRRDILVGLPRRSQNLVRPQPPQNPVPQPRPSLGSQDQDRLVPAYINFPFHCIQQTISDAPQVGTGSRLAPKVQVSVFGVENEGRTLRRPVSDGWMVGWGCGYAFVIMVHQLGVRGWRADRGSTGQAWKPTRTVYPGNQTVYPGNREVCRVTLCSLTSQGILPTSLWS